MLTEKEMEKNVEKAKKAQREHDARHYKKHKETIKKRKAAYRKTQKGAERWRNYFKSEKGKGALKKYYKSEKGKKAVRKNHAKRRSLGFIELNDPFPNSQGHHIDKNFVIYIPTKMHKSVWHNVFTGKNMEQINTMAVDFCYGD